MVFLPRFWGGLPFPPDYLLELSRDLNMGDEPIVPPPTETYKRFYSEPGPARASSPDVHRLVNSAPTPISPKFDELAMGGVDDLLVKTALLKVLQDKTDVNYDVVKFVQHILKFTPNDIPDRISGYTLDEENCKAYSKRTYHKSDTPQQQQFEGERACCKAFQNIVWDLARQVHPQALDNRSFPASLKFLHEQFVQGNFATYKPDFAYYIPDGSKEPRWEFIGGCGELKKARVNRFQPVHAVSMLKIQKLRDEWATPKPQAGTVHKKATLERRKPTPPTKPMTRAASKRKATAEAGIHITKKVKTGSAVHPVSVPQTRPLVKFTKSEIQMAKYINELLSHGIRSYAFGFLVQETRMSLWYVDRMGMATSQSFDIFLDPELFVLVVAALYSANRHHLGTIPLVKYPDGRSFPYDNAILDLPRAIDSEGARIDEPLSFPLRVIPGVSEVVVAYGAIGRGTTVVPITANGRARALFGKDKLVSKLYWPSVNRRSETEIIRAVRRKLGKHKKAKAYLKNIVDLKCSLDMSAAEAGLPRAFMELSEPYEPRLLRVLIMKEYLPLDQIRSLDDFKIVYLDIFDAHHWVFEVAGTLHRDPSLSNFMFHYDRNGKVVGILTDWDVASSTEDLEPTYEDVEDEETRDDTADLPLIPDKGIAVKSQPATATAPKAEGTESQRRPRYRTGTGPFMALDLLATKKITHRYRHDLESFFYVLCYFCAQFRPVTPDNPKAYFAFLHDWESGSMSQIYSKKQEFLLGGEVFYDSFQNVNEAYRPLVDQWIDPLREDVFDDVSKYTLELSKGYAKLDTARRRKDERKEQRALNEIQSISDKADSAIIYDTFRDILTKS